MDKRSFVFEKENFIILGISFLLILIGFLLMSGGRTTEATGFDPTIFSTRRIVVAPIVTMIGFLMVFVAILKKPKNENKQTLEKR